MSDSKKLKDIVSALEGQGETDEARTESIEKIYGEAGIEGGNAGEEVFKERAEFDHANPNASMIFEMIGEKKCWT